MYPALQLLYARSLSGCRDIPALLDFTQSLDYDITSEQYPELMLERVFALMFSQELHKTLHILRELIPKLTGRALGQGYRRLGWLLYEAGADEHDFQPSTPLEHGYLAFEQAAHILKGRDLGLCFIDWANQIRKTDLEKAKALLLEAITYLTQDIYHTAMIYYNLGEWWIDTPATRANRLENQQIVQNAIMNFEKCEEATKKQAASHFRSRGLHARATVHRLGWNFKLAAEFYAKAERAAQLADIVEQDDVRAARWSQARMLRLQGKHDEAIVKIIEAEKDKLATNDLMALEAAAAYLLQGNNAEAERLLNRPRPSLHRHQQLKLILNAELARRYEDEQAMLSFLDHLDWHSVVVREEQLCFAELLGQNTTHAGVIPQGSRHGRTTEVVVVACGAFSVTVDGRAIDLSPDSDLAALLILLLEGRHGREQLAEYLYRDPEMENSRQQPQNPQKSLSNLVSNLRKRLGWQQSIRSHGGQYTLDPDTIWHYDAQKARSSKTPKPDFMSHLYREWALEIRQELENLGQTTQ
jgi:hypothetical protein